MADSPAAERPGPWVTRWRRVWRRLTRRPRPASGAREPTVARPDVAGMPVRPGLLQRHALLRRHRLTRLAARTLRRSGRALGAPTVPLGRSLGATTTPRLTASLLERSRHADPPHGDSPHRDSPHRGSPHRGSPHRGSPHTGAREAAPPTHEGSPSQAASVGFSAARGLAQATGFGGAAAESSHGGRRLTSPSTDAQSTARFDRPLRGTPVQRWQRAVQRQPLEHPAALPARWTALARQITGRSTTRYTAGAATSQALAAAGALGATTGDVLHLAGPAGTADPRVLAHELAHARTPLSRPRFLLADRHDHGDAEERMANSVASHAVAGGVSRSSSGVSRSSRGGPVGSSSFGGLPPSTVCVASERRATFPVASAVARSVNVGSLPVLGVTGLADALARSVAAAEPTTGGPARPADPSRAGSAAVLARAEGSLTPTAPSASSFARSPQPFTMADDGEQPVARTTQTPAAPGAAQASTAVPGLDLDQVVEALEERVLRELERRGGRYEGVF